MQSRICLDLKRHLVVVAVTFLGALCGLAGEPGPLENAFLVPPASAKPAMWWFWGESVTTDHGITQDLEALKRVGFSGVVIYEQVFGDGPDALKSLSPEWMARVRFAAAECARLGMTLEINACSGYVASGPWITLALGMQRLVSSEWQVEGGSKFSGVLPQPPTQAGLLPRRGGAPLFLLLPATTPTERHRRWKARPPIHGLSDMFDPSTRWRADISPGPADQPVLIQMDYGHPFTARGLSYAISPISKALVLVTQQPGDWSDDPAKVMHYVIPPHRSVGIQQ